MLITRETAPLEHALQWLGFYRFNEQSCQPKANAQANLAGRTHYTDEQTLKYFKSKIVAFDIFS